MKHKWEYRRLEDASHELFAGGDVPKDYSKEQTKEYKYPIYTNGIERCGLYGFSCNARVKDNAITISSRGTIGAVFARSEPFTPAIRLITIIPKTDISVYFLAYFIKSTKISGNGVTIPQLTVPMVKNLPVPVPPMEVQEQIVAELDKINETIEDCRELLRTLDSLANSLFYDTFGDPVTNPKGWEIKMIGEIASVQTGATPSREDTSNFIGNIPWVKTTEVQNGFIDSTEEHISEDALQNSNCKIFPVDTIIIAMYGQGKTRGQVGFLRIPACTNQACAAILPSEKVIPIYTFKFLKASYEPLRNKAVGCNQKNLNLSLIKSYNIPVPPIALQEQFAAQVEAIEAQKKAVEATIAELQTLLDSRMDYWFN